MDRIPDPSSCRGGINLMALFVVVELQVKHPLLNVRIFTYWPFVNSCC